MLFRSILRLRRRHALHGDRLPAANSDGADADGASWVAFQFQERYEDSGSRVKGGAKSSFQRRPKMILANFVLCCSEFKDRAGVDMRQLQVVASAADYPGYVRAESLTIAN